MTTGGPGAEPHGTKHGVGFWAAAAVGGAFMAFGVHTLVRTRAVAPVGHVLPWLVGLLVFHDAVITIALIVAGWVLTRWLPDWLLGPVRGALALSLLIVVFSAPLWRRYGIDPANPSRLPLDYAPAVLTVLGLVWLAAAAVAAQRWRTRPPLR
jgi:amino acid transporter